MKVVVMSDPHIAAPGQRVRGIDTAQRLATCVTRINEIAGDADLCVLMGDNVHEPSRAAYEILLERLRPLRMPIRMLIGNHDDRDMLIDLRPDLPRDEEGFLQSAFETDAAVLLFLDTHRPGSDAGDYGPRKLRWLREQLRRADGRPVYAFMHHPPVRTGLFSDHSMVVEADALMAAMAEAGTVRQIIFGHTHRASTGHWNGIAWTGLHGLAYQNDFELLPGKPNYRSGPAQIGILLIERGRSALHLEDILEPYPLIAYSGRSRRAPFGPGASA